MIPQRKAKPGTPNALVLQLWQPKVKALEAKQQRHLIRLTRTNDKVTLVEMKSGKTVMQQSYDFNDKDSRRILLHRVWRWSNKTTWRKR